MTLVKNEDDFVPLKSPGDRVFHRCGGGTRLEGQAFAWK